MGQISKLIKFLKTYFMIMLWKLKRIDKRANKKK